MKTSKKISKINSQNKIILFFSIIALLIFLCSIIFHITPLKMLDFVSDFTVHHYFLSGFFAVLLFSICMKLYFFNTNIINALHGEKKLLRDLKIKDRKKRIQNFRKNVSLKVKLIKNKMTPKNYVSISKYNKSDILLTNEQIEIRNQDLKYAMNLGNTLKQNVKLYYKEFNLHKCIETVILFVNNEHVAVRGGLVLPIKSIYKVEI